MLRELALTGFLERTAASDPVPGGGSVSALAGAAAAGLTAMVARLTLGRKGFDDVQARMEAIVQQADQCREVLATAVDRDAEAYAAVMEALRLPQGTREEKEARSRALQAAFEGAAEVPLQVAEAVLGLMGWIEEVVSRGNPNCASDGAVAALMARAAARGALYNVRVNLGAIRDAQFVARVGARARELEAEADRQEAGILKRVKL